jgi:hypothetical protein
MSESGMECPKCKKWMKAILQLFLRRVRVCKYVCYDGCGHEIPIHYT